MSEGPDKSPAASKTRWGPKISSWLRERIDLDRFGRVIWAVLFQVSLDESVPFRQAWQQALQRPMPPHAPRRTLFLGGITLFLLVVQVITGGLLAIYYRPSLEGAHSSLAGIMTEVPLGWLVRQLHAWCSNLIILGVFLHLLRAFFNHAYRRPREPNWILGVLLLFLTLIFGFTGHLLPWDQTAYWATARGTDVIASLPGIGPLVLLLIRGGETVTGLTLSRFFALHVIILPWVTTFLLALHLGAVRHQGLSSPPDPLLVDPEREDHGSIGPDHKPYPFYPLYLLDFAMVVYGVIGVLLTLAVLFPFGLADVADPLQPPGITKPPWYFLPAYQLINWHRPSGVATIILGGVLLLGWPFFAESLRRRFHSPRAATVCGVVALAVLLGLGLLGNLSDRTVTVGEQTYRFDHRAVPHREREGREGKGRGSEEGGRGQKREERGREGRESHVYDGA